MRGPGETIRTAVFAAAIGVHRAVEGQVGRGVAAEHAAGALFGDRGARVRSRFAVLEPAVVFGLVQGLRVATGRVGDGAPALGHLRRRFVCDHGASLRRPGLRG